MQFNVIMFAADMTTVVCDKMEKVNHLLKTISDTPTLKLIILLGTPSDEDKKHGEEKNVEILSWDDLMQLGKDNLKDPVVCSLVD